MEPGPGDVAFIDEGFGVVELLLCDGDVAGLSALGGLFIDSGNLSVGGDAEVGMLTVDSSPFGAVL
ncbi:MAG: hypothetical protein ACYTGC_03800, partial [Planctomycetota bacterium]